MGKSKAAWVVVGGREGELAHCTRCGRGLSINLPLSINVVVGATNGFIKDHLHCKEGQYVEPKPTPLNWRSSRDTGISSCTIYAVMTGCGERSYDAPHDPDDFGRCYRLLQLFPEWVADLPRVAKRFPIWGPMVARWAEMTALYEEELPQKSAPKLYALMQQLREEGMLADGWVKTGPSSWSKPHA